MGDFLRLVLDFIKELWPLRIVHQWERGGYYVFGRFKRELEPGIYPVVPWFTTVKEIEVVPAMIETGRQDITLQDGIPVSFSASAWVRVIDYNLAVNTVYDHEHTVKELLRAVLADKIASVDASRLRPEGRARLLSDLTRWVDQEAHEYGLEVTKVRFTSFVSGVRTIRLLQDAAVNW